MVEEPILEQERADVHQIKKMVRLFLKDVIEVQEAMVKIKIAKMARPYMRDVIEVQEAME